MHRAVLTASSFKNLICSASLLGLRLENCLKRIYFIVKARKWLMNHTKAAKGDGLVLSSRVFGGGEWQ